jgi:hypothetical protein
VHEGSNVIESETERVAQAWSKEEVNGVPELSKAVPNARLNALLEVDVPTIDHTCPSDRLHSAT